MAKALFHLVPRYKSAAVLADRLRDEVSALRSAKPRDDAQVNLLTALEEDPLNRGSHFGATIEVRAESEAAISTLVDGLGFRLDDILHADLSTALLGEDRMLVVGERAPLRYQYLMRRNAKYDRAAYLRHYRDHHSQFGPLTPGILSYAQFYIDTEASRRLAEKTGFGIWGVDSVSELHMESVDGFIAEVVKSETPALAAADEKTFVDRKRSADFCSTVDWDET